MNNEGGKNTFIMYTDYFRHIKRLTMEQRGELFTAILSFASGEELEEMDAATEIAFSFIQERMERDASAYEEKCRKRSESGRLGGRPSLKKADEMDDEGDPEEENQMVFQEKQKKQMVFQEKQKNQMVFQEKQKKQMVFSEKQKKANVFFEKQKNPDNDNENDNENDILKDLTVSNETVCRTDVRRVMDEWNSLSAFGIASVSKITTGSKRHQMLVARIKEYGMDEVLRAIGSIRNSNFLQGKNDKGWTITFDWFVRPNNFPKVLDGNYANREPEKKPSPERTQNNTARGAGKNRFCNFSQREYDYDQLERMALTTRASGDGEGG